jgi:hypothetical protein
MDEVLEIAELAVDTGLEGIIAWILRLLGIVALAAGLFLWLATDASLLLLPAALMVVGVILLVVPSILLFVLELVA